MSGIVIRAGELRDRIRIERRANVPDGAGNFEAQWRVMASGIPARIRDQRGGETIQAGRYQGVSNHEIAVMADDVSRAVDANYRIVDESTGATFAVQWAGYLDDLRRWRVMACQRGTADG